ncbi:MAG: 2-oxoacid:acceptor oxidoreductase family protein [Firmicutes bacterium]|nr:2-oxoacid:acceptor oxidoreductase family protein [Bacillota bacterium]MBQ6012458.1 2-oxoacid:acceptor oxidoreductase family protein [Bacillota bacterium]MBQ6259760.1 2-oxoacid:acceptor oxidoreductase family protein [Bacillota bacterium]MBR0115452.1 2-oxoacid:acceptor oxidoreductase family protein [Bacillota bacterium]MBR0441670.1 2-oxoacid:acceptor oxidoreductase family protein [Bacillota bacterium]
MTTNILIAGFGGQGILFAGKVLAYKGLLEDKQLSWLPSYGPEMRGGTANCNIIISDEPVGSPIVFEPDILVVMNRPSLDKYEKEVVPGGMILVDSAMVDRKVERTDVRAVYIPATTLASQLGTPGLANMVLVGKLMKECPELAGGSIEEVLHKVISARHADLFESNLNAVKKGMEY